MPGNLVQDGEYGLFVLDNPLAFCLPSSASLVCSWVCSAASPVSLSSGKVTWSAAVQNVPLFRMLSVPQACGLSHKP